MSGDFVAALTNAGFGKIHLTWMPRWYDRFQEFLEQERILKREVTRDVVVRFCRTLVQSRTPAWQRLQAVRAIDAYHDLVLRHPVADLADVFQGLERLAAQERQSADDDRPGERDEAQIIGVIDPDEAPVLQKTRRELRVQGLMLRTERAYIGWIKRYLTDHGTTSDVWNGKPGCLPPQSAIREFLTSLAVEGRVARSTQVQAKSALLFLYQRVFGEKLSYLDAVPADKPKRLPVVLSREEIGRLLPLFSGIKQLMCLLMYGAGLRHLECRRLRVKDVCLDQNHLIIRSGKGDQDRISVLPDRARIAVADQIERVRILHKRDLAEGCGRVYLPHALERKVVKNPSPQPSPLEGEREESLEFGWQWLFPARQTSVDPVSGERRRHHVCENFFATEFKRRLRDAEIDKRAVPHSLRSALA